MPKQSRGFWVCLYCELAFDQYQEADFHERTVHLQQPSQRHPQPQPQMIATVSEPLPWRQQPLLHGGMAPIEEQTTSTHPKPAQMQRYLPLMGSQEPSHLNPSDTLACRSYELFEVTDLFGSSDSEPVAGQVGLRCAFCAETPKTTSSYVFPANAHSIGDSLRHACFGHLLNCTHFPEEYKRQIDEAVRRRKRCKEEGGPAAAEEEHKRKTLVDFCQRRCQQAGIVNRRPTGLMFADVAQSMPPHTSMVQQQPIPPQVYAEQPPYQATQSRKAQETAKRNDNVNTLDTPPTAASQSYPSQYVQPTFSSIQNEFPYYFEHNRWICRFCAHVPPPYRDSQYLWSNSVSNPPPGHFIDYHLSLCREYQKAVVYDQQYAGYRGMDPRLAGLGGTWELQMQQQQHRPPQEQHVAEIMTPNQRISEYTSSRELQPSPYSSAAYPSATPPGHVPLSRLPNALATNPVSRHTSRQSETPEEILRAIDYLEKHDLSQYDNEGHPVAEVDRLVLDEDRLLLTDYFYYLMKQLRLVRFSETDRRTRGGKRENIQVGYGGLQCVHCVDIPNTRKFFWSNVDRLANSFAEIPSHVLKCRRCPQPSKDALLHLKQVHAEQMTRLPRGSQKVFFRRMWRRLHDADPQSDDPREGDQATADYDLAPSPIVHPDSSDYLSPTSRDRSMRPEPIETKLAVKPAMQHGSDNSPDGTNGSDESMYFSQCPSNVAAKTLAAAAANQLGQPSPSSRVLLAIPEDKEWLSDIDCFIRRQLEVFCASVEDVRAASEDRKYPVREGQVGIRCIHCAMATSGSGAYGQAVAFPFSISGIYESVREFQRLHLDHCENLPLSAKSKLESLQGSSSLSSVLRKYFVLAAKALGLQDSVQGIRAGGESIPMGSQVAFAFTESGPSDEMTKEPPQPQDAQPSFKRKADDYQTIPDGKRPAVASTAFSSVPFARLEAESKEREATMIYGSTRDDTKAKMSQNDDSGTVEL